MSIGSRETFGAVVCEIETKAPQSAVHENHTTPNGRPKPLSYVAGGSVHVQNNEAASSK